jgi:hypothetical protein
LGVDTIALRCHRIRFLAANDFFFIPLLLGILITGIIVVYYCLFRPLVGFYLATVGAFFYFLVLEIIRMPIPLSTSVELLLLFVFLGSFLEIRSKDNKVFGFYKTGISISLFFIFFMMVIEAFNPNITGLQGWVPSFKRVIVSLLIYFTAYRLIDTPAKFQFFVYFWIGMAFITALYGCYQQFFGYSNFELEYINSTPGAMALLFQGGQLRKYSFLSDVPTFALLSGAMAAFTFLLAINEKRLKLKYCLLAAAFIMEMGMAFSGTRTANIMFPCALALYGIITIQHKTTVIALFASFLFVMFILFAPIYSNLTINRIRTTFNTRDESLTLRDDNRHYIQPYIYNHPIGGGVATTGKEGLNFYPDHPLADFPPDSGILKIALEQGWVGLSVNLFLYLMIFYQGIYYYFRMRHEDYRKYVAIVLSTIFCIVVTMYSQMSIGQFPTVIFIFSCLALLSRLKEFDDKAIWKTT